MFIANKKQGQKILAKLKKEEHVWLSVFFHDFKKRIKFELVEDYDPPKAPILNGYMQPLVLCVHKQRLHALWHVNDSWNDRRFTDGIILAFGKKVYGVAVEAHDKKEKK